MGLNSVFEDTLESISSYGIDENSLYSIKDYPIGGITQEQMNNALLLSYDGIYQINSVYMCINDGTTYLKNHCYKYTYSDNNYQWVDITPWNESINTTLNEINTVDTTKLYSIIDYPIGGITNEQMNDALTDAQEGFYQVGSVYMCTDDGTYLKNHFYKFNELSWEDVTPEFAGELKDLTLEELESEVIDEDTLYNIKDYPIGGISSLQMVNALKPEQLGFYQVGSVYLCTDGYSDYIKHHFYRFNYDEETDTYSWVDTKAGADIDKELSLESENPVANKIVTEALEGKVSLTGDEDIYGVKSFESRPKLGIQQGLPEEYQEVEFIQTTGTQYIDTGIALSDNITKLETSYYRTTTGTRQILFGMYGGSCELYFEYTENGESYQRIYLNGTSLSSKVPVQIGKFNSSIEIKDSQLIYTTNGHSVSATYTNTNTSDTHCYLFADYSNGNPIYMYQCQLYSFRIWSGENLLREFIPCYRKEDNKVGLYDTVSELFYENIGTGEFLKGDNIYRGIDFATVDDIAALEPSIENKVSLDKDEVIKGQKVFTERPQIGEIKLPNEFTEVEYIEGTGTQYIDTGFGSSDGMNIQTKFSYTKIGRPLFGSHNLSSPYNRNFFVINPDGTFQLAYGNNLNLKVAGGLVNTIYNVDFQTRPTSAKLFVNGTEIINTSSGQSISNLSVIIFGVNYSITYNEEMASARIFNFKIFDINDNLVRDFIPCYVNTEVVNNEITYPVGAIGLYDLVEGKFYVNQGTGEFLKGEDILTGEYLALQSEIPELDANPEETTETLKSVNIKGISYKIDYSPYKVTELSIDGENIYLTIE